MKVVFIASEKKREIDLGQAFIAGAEKHGHTGFVHTKGDGLPDCDLAAMVGVKSRDIFRDYRERGIDVVMIDKGYQRQRVGGVWEYWRIAVNAHHPTDALGRDMPEDRLNASGLELQRWRKRGKHIVIAGSSAKYHRFYDLPEPTGWAMTLAKQIRAITAQRIIYRPKPSWQEAVPIPGTIYSGATQKLPHILDGASCLITHGSNACVEAVLAGVPCVILGNGVAKPISSIDVADIEAPILATMAERRQWLANLCYWQWTKEEFASGAAFNVISGELA